MMEEPIIYKYKESKRMSLKTPCGNIISFTLDLSCVNEDDFNGQKRALDNAKFEDFFVVPTKNERKQPN